MAFPLYFDEDSSDARVIEGLTARGVACSTTFGLGRDQSSDDEQLDFCEAQRLVIVTANQGDYAMLHAERLASGQSHAGIIILTRQQIGPGLVITKLMSLQEQFDEDQMRDSIHFISPSPLP